MLSLGIELNSLIDLSSSELDLGELEYSTSEQPVCSWAGVQAGRDGINCHHICHSKLVLYSVADLFALIFARCQGRQPWLWSNSHPVYDVLYAHGPGDVFWL